MSFVETKDEVYPGITRYLTSMIAPSRENGTCIMTKMSVLLVPPIPLTTLRSVLLIYSGSLKSLQYAEYRPRPTAEVQLAQISALGPSSNFFLSHGKVKYVVCFHDSVPFVRCPCECP